MEASGRYDMLPEKYDTWSELRKSAYIAAALADIRKQEAVLIKGSRKLNYNGIFDKSKIDERPDELK